MFSKKIFQNLSEPAKRKVVRAFHKVITLRATHFLRTKQKHFTDFL